MKGAVDDLDMVIKTLEDSGFKDRFYIHCDGALFGLMMPFVKRVSPLVYTHKHNCVNIDSHAIHLALTHFPGTKSNIQETNWECERIRTQVCWMSNAMWCTNNQTETYQCVLKECRVFSIKRCNHHGKPKRSRPDLLMVHTKP